MIKGPLGVTPHTTKQVTAVRYRKWCGVCVKVLPGWEKEMKQMIQLNSCSWSYMIFFSINLHIIFHLRGETPLLHI